MTLWDLHDVPTLPLAAAGLPRRPNPEPEPLLTRRRKQVVADIRAYGRDRHWSEAEVVRGIAKGLRLQPLAAYRVWRWWTADEAVSIIRAAASEGGVDLVFTTEDLTNWEAGHRRVPVELLDAVCLVYRTRPDWVGYDDYS